MEAESFIAGAIWGSLTFMAGALVNHKLAIAREKRKEFNEAARPIRIHFLAAVRGSRSALPSSLEIDAFESCLSWWGQWRFGRAYGRYVEECRASCGTYDPALGSVVGAKPELIVAAARRCLKFVAVK